MRAGMVGRLDSNRSSCSVNVVVSVELAMVLSPVLVCGNFCKHYPNGASSNHDLGHAARHLSLSLMGSWLVRRRLGHVSKRLRTLRDELATVDEQLAHLRDDADDLALRAIVAESPAASLESKDARKHVDAM